MYMFCSIKKGIPIYKRGTLITKYRKVYKLENGVLLCKWNIFLQIKQYIVSSFVKR